LAFLLFPEIPRISKVFKAVQSRFFALSRVHLATHPGTNSISGHEKSQKVTKSHNQMHLATLREPPNPAGLARQAGHCPGCFSEITFGNHHKPTLPPACAIFGKETVKFSQRFKGIQSISKQMFFPVQFRAPINPDCIESVLTVQYSGWSSQRPAAIHPRHSRPGSLPCPHDVDDCPPGALVGLKWMWIIAGALFANRGMPWALPQLNGMLEITP
jgi:hypothetical protein